MSNKIILVGNGSTLLEKENGKLIDSFDLVVRFNAFFIDGYEKYVGAKTDIWFNVINFVDKEKEKRIKYNWKEIYLHSWQWDKNKDLLYVHFDEFFRNKNVSIPLVKTKKDIIDEIYNFHGEDKEYRSYSTGLIAIWMMLKVYSYVTITGFDWWHDNMKHHYGDAGKIGTLHKPQIEKKIINKLMNSGKVVLL